MYTSYFGLTERPFSIAPDPQYLYMSTRHKEAMAHLSYGLSQGGCFIVLTGEVGTGKTTLCRNLLSEIKDSVDVALILNAKINELELLQTVCDELSIQHDQDATQKQLLDQINQHLLNTYADNRQTVMIIDEAQLLARDVLEQIRLLTNLETTKQKLLQIILIGQPELNDLLSRTDLRQLAQRVTARYHLGPLRSNEIEDYVNYRLGVAGCKQPLFSKQALSKLHQATDGIPRKINVLADHSLLATYSKSERLVNAKTIKSVAQEVFISPRANTSNRIVWSNSTRRWALPLVALLVLNIGLWWWFTAPADTDPEKTVASVNREDSGAAPNREAAAAEVQASQVPKVATTESTIETTTIAGADSLTDVIESEGTSVPTQNDLPIEQADQAESTSATVIINPASEPGTVSISEEYLSVDTDTVDVLDSEFAQALEASSDLTGRIAAFRKLTQTWGVTLPQTLIQPVCQALGSNGLGCVAIDDWQQLQRFNRPAILVLSHKDQLHRVVLTSLNDINAKVLIGEQEQRVSVAELKARWVGNGVIVWRPGDVGSALLQRGDQSESIPNLRRRLNQVLAQTNMPLLASVDSPEFDMEMSQKVFALQTRFSILQDSKVGNETNMLLNEILQPQLTPVLARRAF